MSGISGNCYLYGAIAMHAGKPNVSLISSRRSDFLVPEYFRLFYSILTPIRQRFKMTVAVLLYYSSSSHSIYYTRIY